MKRNYAFILILSILFCGSCRSSKQTIYTYEPVSGQTSTVIDRKATKVEANGIVIILALDHNNGREMAFDIRINNNTTMDQTILLDKFFITPTGKDKIRIFALNPNVEMDKIENFNPNSVGNRMTQNAFNCCITSILTVIFNTICGQKTDAGLRENMDKEMNNKEDLNTDTYQYHKSNDLALYQIFALRSGVIHAKQQISGKLFFRFKATEPSYDLNLMIGENANIIKIAKVPVQAN